MTAPVIQGIAYPLTVVDGQLATATDADLVRHQIFSVLETRPRERVMQPRYGMPDQNFELAIPGIIGNSIERSLQQEIPQATFNVAVVDYDNEGGIEVEIRWSLGSLPQAPINFEYRT